MISIKPILILTILFGACTAQLCNDIIREKELTITTPDDIKDHSTCTIFIEPSNPNVCQVRVGIRQFDLLQPEYDSNTKTLSCDREYMDTVTSNVRHNVRLCGENDFQHVYLHMGQYPYNLVSLNFKIRDNTTQGSPSWILDIRQLECSQPPMNGLIQDESRLSADDDAFWVAPFGCLQFQKSGSGPMRSFNYNNGNGPYLPNMNYAFCYHRAPNHKSFDIILDDFDVGRRTPYMRYENDCINKSLNDDSEGFDHLIVTGGQIVDPVLGAIRANRFCGQWQNGTNRLHSFLPGPIVVHFQSDNKLDAFGTEKGFFLTGNMQEF